MNIKGKNPGGDTLPEFGYHARSKFHGKAPTIYLLGKFRAVPFLGYPFQLNVVKRGMYLEIHQSRNMSCNSYKDR